jgi:hypothetical protein
MISRVFPWTTLLLLGLCLFNGPTYSADCLDIDSSDSKVQRMKLKGNLLLVYLNQAVVAGAVTSKRDEQATAKILLRREFTRYFQLLENWNFLEIKSSKGIYGLLRCNEQTIYIFEINLSDVQVLRLPPAEATADSSSDLDMPELNKEPGDQFEKFDKFK